MRVHSFVADGASSTLEGRTGTHEHDCGRVTPAFALRNKNRPRDGQHKQRYTGAKQRYGFNCMAHYCAHVADGRKGCSGISGPRRVGGTRRLGISWLREARGVYGTVSAGGTSTDRREQQRVRGQQGCGADERRRVNVSTSVASWSLGCSPCPGG